jgi:maltose O-acetyltransferase
VDRRGRIGGDIISIISIISHFTPDEVEGGGPLLAGGRPAGAGAHAEKVEMRRNDRMPEIYWLAAGFVRNVVLASGVMPPSLRVAALRLMGIEIGCALVAPRCHIGRGPLKIGDGCFVNRESYLDTTAGIYIGQNVRLAPRVTIITASHTIGGTEATRTSRTPETDLQLPVHIGDNVWIGTGAIILPGVTVGNGVVVGAGAVVRADCEANTLYAGVPARAIRKLQT